MPYLDSPLPRCFYLSLFLAAASLVSCSSTPSAPKVETETVSNALADAKEHEFKTGENAKVFDKFLADELPAKEKDSLLEHCRQDSDSNLFCISILDKDGFEGKTRHHPNPVPTSAPVPRRSTLAIYAKFKKKQLSNWIDLRFSPVSAVIKGLVTNSFPEVQRVRTLALKEKKCPNNAAIAIAASLEDYLPEKIKYGEIGTLYEKGADCLLGDPSEHEVILTRAGLFYFAAHDFKKALSVFQKAVKEESVFRARSLYWLHRTQMELGRTKAAKKTLETLTQTYPFSFHTLVALTGKKRDPGDILARTTFSRKTRSDKNTTINTLLEQVEVLHKWELNRSAAKVLDWAIAESQSGIEPELMVYLSDLKAEEGDHSSPISILSDVLYKNPELISRDTLERYFPKLFFPVFEKQSVGLDPYLLLAVARRESAFNTRAISSANAQGLLQVTPSTLKEMNFDMDLMDPENNILAGATLLNDLLKRMNGHVHLALAAYNAGPSKLETWTNRYPLNEPILFIDMIPFRETREYVAAVLRNYYWYRRIHGEGTELCTPQNLIEPDPVRNPAKN